MTRAHPLTARLLAAAVALAPALALAAAFKAGDVVNADVNGQVRRGKVLKVAGGQAQVKFDDGSVGWARPNQLSAASADAPAAPAPEAAPAAPEKPAQAPPHAEEKPAEAAPAAAPEAPASDLPAGPAAPDGMAPLGDPAQDPVADPNLAEIARTLGGGAKALSTARFVSARYDSVNFEGASMTGVFEFSNTTASPLSLEKFDWGLKVGPNRLVGGTSAPRESFAAGSKARLAVPVKLDFAAVPGLVASIAKGKPRFAVEAVAYMKDAKGAPYVVPMRWAGQFAAPKLPGIALQSLELGDVGITELTLNFILAVTNPNPFPIPVDNVAGTFAVNNAEVAKVALPAPVIVQPSAATDVTVPLTLDIAELSSDVIKQIRAGKATYAFSGEVKVAGKSLPWKYRGGAKKR